MSTKEKVQLVVISVVLAVILAILYGRFYPSQTVAPGPGPGQTGSKPGRGGDTDDAPIIMAGGSIIIGTDYNGRFTRNQDALKFEDGFKVFAIELTDMSDVTSTITTPDLVGAKGWIDAEYCLVVTTGGVDRCVANQTDLVTLSFDNSTGAISVTNTDQNKKVGKARRISSTLWRHKINNRTMFAVKVYINDRNTPKISATCGKEADCGLLVHTCKNFTNCTPQ